MCETCSTIRVSCGRPVWTARHGSARCARHLATEKARASLQPVWIEHPSGVGYASHRTVTSGLRLEPPGGIDDLRICEYRSSAPLRFAPVCSRRSSMRRTIVNRVLQGWTATRTATGGGGQSGHGGTSCLAGETAVGTRLNRGADCEPIKVVSPCRRADRAVPRVLPHQDRLWAGAAFLDQSRRAPRRPLPPSCWTATCRPRSPPPGSISVFGTLARQQRDPRPAGQPGLTPAAMFPTVSSTGPSHESPRAQQTHKH